MKSLVDEECQLPGEQAAAPKYAVTSGALLRRGFFPGLPSFQVFPGPSKPSVFSSEGPDSRCRNCVRLVSGLRAG
ncbi:MAG TPA: hypothetical protein DDW52_29625 [Planctomycetaceae bacterium]|nr:hypothetical protein [Planctomycetaceae bacterium]